jgi:HK97 family phage major capsid protein
MKNSEELRGRLEALRTEITELSELDDITPEQDSRLDEAIAEATEVRDELVKAEERAAVIAEIAQRDDVRATPAVPTSFHVQRKVDVDVDPAGSISEVRDAAFKLLDQADWADDYNREAVEGALKGRNGIASSEVARRLVATESDAYRSAFFKVSTGAQYALTADEGEALARANALSPATAGGLGVPVIIDPTILITSGKGLTGILAYSRIESISNNEWKGVSAAETAWSFDAEASQVSDDASVLSQPTVPVHMARGFIPYSIEIGMDYPGFATEMGRLLNSGYQALLAEKLAVGSGSGEPSGIFPTLATTSEVTVTTAGSFGAVDLDKVWASLEERFRGSSTWFMSVDVENRIRAFSAGDNYNRFTVDQTAGGLMMLNGRPVVLSDFAPSFAGATAGTARNIAVIGDFSNFVVAQRVGMNVELVPHLFGANQRPTGQRGWFAYARVGADSVVDNAFRRLQNKAT